MKIAITGATGFVGRHLLRSCLSMGHVVKALTRQHNRESMSNLKYYTGSLSDSYLLAEFVRGVDVVCHCAGEISNEKNYMKTNFEGTKNIYEACLQERVNRLVHLSSVGVYGDLFAGNILESQPMIAMNDYEQSKIAADEYLLSRSFEGKVQVAILRPSQVFGVDMPNNSLRDLVRNIQRGTFLFVDKSASASLVSVNEVAEAMYRLSVYSYLSGVEIFNLSSSISWDRFVNIVCGVMRVDSKFRSCPKLLLQSVAVCAKLFMYKHAPISLARIRAMSKHVVYDSSKIQRRIGFDFDLELANQLRECVRSWCKIHDYSEIS